jgi:putative membrane protein
MNAYLLFKSLHLIAVISWMAGLLYLPRIFVYHAENMNKEEICTVFKTMEKKLYNYIMMPAMLLSWLFGLILISHVGFETLSAKWLQIKLVLVILLSIYHFYLGSLLLSFSQNR